MALNPQTFTTEFLVPGLVAWYNAQPADLRVIETNDVAIFRVRLILKPNGQMSMIIGEEPYDVLGDKYLGEATFIWRGARGINLVATADSFFEISKYIVPPTVSGNGAVNIVPFTGFAVYPEVVDTPEEIVYKMTFGHSYRYGSEVFFSVGLTGFGEPQVRTRDTYVTINPSVDNIVEVSAGELWVVGRSIDKRMCVWGQNYMLTNATTAYDPYWIDMSNYTGNSDVISVGALRSALIAIDGDGEAVILGDTQLVNTFVPPSNVKEVVTYWAQEIKAPWNDPTPTLHNQSVAYFIHNDGRISVQACEVHSGSVNESPGVIYAPSAYVSDAFQIAGTFKTGCVLDQMGVVKFWGDVNPEYHDTTNSSYFMDAVQIACTYDNQWAIRYANGSVQYFNETDGWSTHSPGSAPATQISGGGTYFAILHEDDNVTYVGQMAHGQDATRTTADRNGVLIKQIHAGTWETGAMLEDGSFIWWGGGID